jgi:hypothetical protein
MDESAQIVVRMRVVGEGSWAGRYERVNVMIVLLLTPRVPRGVAKSADKRVLGMFTGSGNNRRLDQVHRRRMTTSPSNSMYMT